MSFLSLLRHRKDLVEYESGDVIYSKGEPADTLYVIVVGEVELSVHDRSLGIEGEGSIIGEMALLESATRNSTATARSSVKLARLDRTQLKKLIGEHADFALRAMTVLANRLRAVDQLIIAKLDS
jgi:CRP/FNR family cyclic AMP-dependent transcriptional regulator